MTVAVIDTGVDYNNPALGGGFGPGNKVIAGYDFADGTRQPRWRNRRSQHGTAVAGLIGSSNPNDLGRRARREYRRPESHRQLNTASLQQRRQRPAVGHQQSRRSTTSRVVNMSLSDGENYAQNWFANDGGVGQQSPT